MFTIGIFPPENAASRAPPLSPHCRSHVNTALWDYKDLLGKNKEGDLEISQFPVFCHLQLDKAVPNALIKIQHFFHVDEWRILKVPIVHCLHYLSGCHNVNSADE